MAYNKYHQIWLSPVFSMFTSTDSLYSGELFLTMINVFQ